MEAFILEYNGEDFVFKNTYDVWSFINQTLPEEITSVTLHRVLHYDGDAELDEQIFKSSIVLDVAMLKSLDRWGLLKGLRTELEKNGQDYGA